MACSRDAPNDTNETEIAHGPECYRFSATFVVRPRSLEARIFTLLYLNKAARPTQAISGETKIFQRRKANNEEYTQ